MKKAHLVLTTSVVAALLVASCQNQQSVDPAVMDAKVKEAYEAKIKQIDEEAAAACEARVAEKVKFYQDSLSHVSAAQQAALMAKMQRDLDAANKKAKEVAKKKVTSLGGGKGTNINNTINTKVNSTENKPVLNEQGNQIGTSTKRGDNTDQNIKLDDKGNQVGTSTKR